MMIKHGTINGYTNQHCRCDDCLNAIRAHRDRANPSTLKRYAARVAGALPHLKPEDAQAIRTILRGATT